MVAARPRCLVLIAVSLTHFFHSRTLHVFFHTLDVFVHTLDVFFHRTLTDSSTTPYPFVLWRNTQRQKADKNKPTDTWSETHLHKFYQMWEELPDGAQRFAVGSDDANIQVQGFRANGVPDTLFVAVNSLRPWKASGAPTKVDLSWVTDGAAFGSVAALIG